MLKLREKYRNMNAAVKAAMWFTICNVILYGISFFVLPVFSRLLSHEEYGLLTVFASYEQVILIIATWELPLSSYQKGLFKYKNDVDSLALFTQLFSNGLTFLVFLLVFAFYPAVTSFTKFSLWTIGALFAYLIFQPAYSSWIVKKRTEFDYKKVVIVTIILAVLQIIFPLIAVLFIDATANVKFVFALVPAILFSLFFYILNFTKVKSLIHSPNKKSYFKFYLSFAAPLVIHSLSYLILAQADRIMIDKFVDSATAGIYSTAYSIASIVIIIQTSVIQVLKPWIYKKLEAKQYATVSKTTTTLIAVVSLLYILFMLVAPEIITILFDDFFHEGIWCVPPIATGVFFMLMYSVFTYTEEYFENTKFIAIISLVCAGLNIVLNYFGIMFFGYIACAYTTLICYILFAVGHFLCMKFVCRKKIPGVKMFNGFLILLISLIIIVVMVGITFLYKEPSDASYKYYLIARYGIIVISLILCLIFRKKIFALVKLLRDKHNGSSNETNICGNCMSLSKERSQIEEPAEISGELPENACDVSQPKIENEAQKNIDENNKKNEDQI